MRLRATELLFTALILLGWLVSLLVSLTLRIDQLPWWALLIAVLIRTQLQTGLFIVGHDAMHRLLWRGQNQWNDTIGSLALMLYAALPYCRCRLKHIDHHRAPGSPQDPDFPARPTGGVLGWYLEFMAGYLSRGQMARLLSGWGVLAGICWFFQPQTTANVLLFCTLPLLLSSMQLFIVGTYLPHRVQRQNNQHQPPESLNLPTWLSLLACFHFGYHRTHHEQPNLPWFQLPKAHHGNHPLALSGDAL